MGGMGIPVSYPSYLSSLVYAHGNRHPLKTCNMSNVMTTIYEATVAIAYHRWYEKKKYYSPSSTFPPVGELPPRTLNRQQAYSTGTNQLAVSESLNMHTHVHFT